MAKKLHLDINFNQDNSLLGISCHKQDYWVAYKLNETLHIKLKRMADLPVYIQSLEQTYMFPLFYFENNDKLLGYYFLANHNPGRKLFPSLKTTDFFLLVNGQFTENEKTELIEKIKKTPKVLTAFEVDFKHVKDLDNFFSDLELHMLKCLKQEK